MYAKDLQETLQNIWDKLGHIGYTTSEEFQPIDDAIGEAMQDLNGALKTLEALPEDYKFEEREDD